jgi:hypothetical protein
MAAPTNAALVKKALANSEPSTHGGESGNVTDGPNSTLVTHLRHARLGISAAQIDRSTPFRWSQIPVLMA